MTEISANRLLFPMDPLQLGSRDQIFLKGKGGIENTKMVKFKAPIIKAWEVMTVWIFQSRWRAIFPVQIL